MVERHLAKVNVAGSNLVSRSKYPHCFFFFKPIGRTALSPSGKAKVCKTFTPGSNPGGASKKTLHFAVQSFSFIKAAVVE